MPMCLVREQVGTCRLSMNPAGSPHRCDGVDMAVGLFHLLATLLACAGVRWSLTRRVVAGQEKIAKGRYVFCY